MELCPSPGHTIKRQPLCWHSIAGNFEGKLCVLCRIVQDQYFASTGCATQNWDFKYFDWTIISRYCMSKPSHPGECQNSWQMFTLRIWYEHVWTINWSWRIPTSNFNLQHQRPPRTRAPTWNGASVFTTKERWLGRVEMGGINVRAAPLGIKHLSHSFKNLAGPSKLDFFQPVLYQNHKFRNSSAFNVSAWSQLSQAVNHRSRFKIIWLKPNKIIQKHHPQFAQFHRTISYPKTHESERLSSFIIWSKPLQSHADPIWVLPTLGGLEGFDMGCTSVDKKRTHQANGGFVMDSR